MSNRKRPTKPLASIPDETEIEYAGETYVITREAMDNLEVMLMLTNGNIIGAVREVIGEEDWARFINSIITKGGKVPFTKTMEFADLLADGPLGNFARSLRSSTSADRR